MERQGFAAVANGVINGVADRHATREVGKANTIARLFPMDEGYVADRPVSLGFHLARRGSMPPLRRGLSAERVGRIFERLNARMERNGMSWRRTLVGMRTRTSAYRTRSLRMHTVTC